MSTMDLARARQAAGNVSKSELARRLGIPVRNVRRMENTPGYDPRFSRVLEIARALGVSTDALVPERAHGSNLPDAHGGTPHGAPMSSPARGAKPARPTPRADRNGG